MDVLAAQFDNEPGRFGNGVQRADVDAKCEIVVRQPVERGQVQVRGVGNFFEITLRFLKQD